MVQSKAFFEKMLADLQTQLKNANINFEESPQGSIVRVKRGNKHTLFQVYNQKNKRVRKIITRDTAMINALARKAYLKAEISMLEKDIRALEVFIQAYEEPSYENVLSRLHERYRKYDMAKRDQDDWSSQQYHRSTYMPQQKNHTTSHGLKVRSKSEMLIAEKLYEHGLPFRYEQILQIDGVDYAPDFTIRHCDGSIVYWEHCGLTGNSRYMNHHWRKMQIYVEAGITPWKNLIITYDDENGFLDLSVIESEIINKLKSSIR